MCQYIRHCFVARFVACVMNGSTFIVEKRTNLMGVAQCQRAGAILLAQRAVGVLDEVVLDMAANANTNHFEPLQRRVVLRSGLFRA